MSWFSLSGVVIFKKKKRRIICFFFLSLSANKVISCWFIFVWSFFSPKVHLVFPSSSLQGFTDVFSLCVLKRALLFSMFPVPRKDHFFIFEFLPSPSKGSPKVHFFSFLFRSPKVLCILSLSKTSTLFSCSVPPMIQFRVSPPFFSICSFLFISLSPKRSFFLYLSKRVIFVDSFLFFDLSQNDIWGSSFSVEGAFCVFLSPLFFLSLSRGSFSPSIIAPWHFQPNTVAPQFPFLLLNPPEPHTVKREP